MSSSGAPSGSRKHQGRRKLEMKKIENESNRKVTFTKRRDGVMKKASELSALTGAEAAVVVFSPSGKAYSFGSPSVDAVANRFLDPNSQPTNAPDDLVPAPGSSNPVELRRADQVERAVQSEQSRKRDLKKGKASFDHRDPQQLDVLIQGYTALDEKLKKKSG